MGSHSQEKPAQTNDKWKLWKLGPGSSITSCSGWSLLFDLWQKEILLQYKGDNRHKQDDNFHKQVEHMALTLRFQLPDKPSFSLL